MVGCGALRRRSLDVDGHSSSPGESVFVEEKWVPFFKTGKELRERLNPGMGDEAD